MQLNMRANTTWAVTSFDSQMIGTVRMSLNHYSDVSLHTFSSLPPLNAHRDTSVIRTDFEGPLYHDKPFSDKFYVNNGSWMRVVFCAVGGVQVLLLETDKDIIGLDHTWIPKTVRMNKTFDATNSDCRFGDESSAEFECLFNSSSVYQFVWRPWKSSELYLYNIVYLGSMTQYNFDHSIDDCIPLPNLLNCSVSMPDSSQSVVVIDARDIKAPKDNEFVSITLRSKVRRRLLQYAGIGSAMGAVVLITVVIGFILCKQKVRLYRSTNSERKELVDSNTMASK